MPKPVYLMTVQEAHKEYNSIIDQISAKYELLDSGECGDINSPLFKAESCELAHLMARMSKLCQRLNLPMPKDLHRPPALEDADSESESVELHAFELEVPFIAISTAILVLKILGGEAAQSHLTYFCRGVGMQLLYLMYMQKAVGAGLTPF